MASSLVNAGDFAVPPIPHPGNRPTAPRLEFFDNGSHELRRVAIEHSPFKIGRCETSDLRIDSAQVSREHAQIYRRGNIWAIRDLGSTNGTHVNGKPVRESFLSDGDILAIAETEVTFVASASTPFQRMATQPIQSRQSSTPPAMLPSEIAVVRAMTEATLWQAIPLRLANVASLASGEVEACWAQQTETIRRADNEFSLGAGHAVGRHYRELAWRRTIEMAQQQSTAKRILVAADMAEFESPRQLVSHLDQLRDGMPRDCELGVAIVLSGNLDPTALDEACCEVRQAELLLALAGFQGSSGQVSELASAAPDYLLLSDTMLKGVTANSQPLRRLQQVLAACQQFGIAVVLPHFACQRTIAQCRQLGYELAIHVATPNETADCRDVVALAS